MNLKRYKEITSEEAIKRIINKEEVFDENEKRFFSPGKSNTVWVQTEHSHGSETSSSGHTLEDLLDKKWFIKKPFDVRAEMLAEPNEWVGAYHDHRFKWIQVGFDAVNMRTKKAYYGYTGSLEEVSGESPTAYELETCIPIEDVPKEDFA